VRGCAGGAWGNAVCSLVFDGELGPTEPLDEDAAVARSLTSVPSHRARRVVGS